jgi:hypothetical protein
MSKEESERLRYETPMVVPLGAVAAGVGADCPTGSGASATCEPGALATPSCEFGTGATGKCETGATFS